MIPAGRLVLAMVIIPALVSCGSHKDTGQALSVEDALTAQNVRQSIDGRYFTIQFDYMNPRRMPARHLEYGYSVHVSGDSIYSYLPYAGRAYMVPYDGGNGLTFQGLMDSYAEKRHKQSTLIDIVFSNTEDKYHYALRVFDNGNATLNVYMQNHESISFSGDMSFIWE